MEKEAASGSRNSTWKWWAKELAGGQLHVLGTRFCSSCEPVIAFKSQELLAAAKVR